MISYSFVATLQLTILSAPEYFHHVHIHIKSDGAHLFISTQAWEHPLITIISKMTYSQLMPPHFTTTTILHCPVKGKKSPPDYTFFYLRFARIHRKIKIAFMLNQKSRCDKWNGPMHSFNPMKYRTSLLSQKRAISPKPKKWSVISSLLAICWCGN